MDTHTYTAEPALFKHAKKTTQTHIHAHTYTLTHTQTYTHDSEQWQQVLFNSTNSNYHIYCFSSKPQIILTGSQVTYCLKGRRFNKIQYWKTVDTLRRDTNKQQQQQQQQQTNKTNITKRREGTEGWPERSVLMARCGLGLAHIWVISKPLHSAAIWDS